MSRLILAGDIGGTKANLAIFERREGRLVPLEAQTFSSPAYPGPGPMVEEFLNASGRKVAGVCLGVPGPVEKGFTVTPNLPWTIRQSELKKALPVDWVILINDLVATGHGVAVLPPQSLVVLNPRAEAREGNAVLLAPGTGLGQGILFWDEGRLKPRPRRAATSISPRAATWRSSC